MKLHNIKSYFSLIRFSHTVFALPFAFAGYFLGIQQPGYSFDIKILVLMLFCMVFARSAAMAFNRITDLRFDMRNPRTAGREIPSGKISVFSATVFVLINSLFFVISAFFINYTVFYLSPVALIVIFFYSYTKRFTSLCHFILGAGLALAPVGAYLSVAPEFAWPPVILGLVVLLWVGGFDIIYSLQDDEFDRNNKLHSLPAKLGQGLSMAVSLLAHLLSAGLLVFLGYYLSAGLLFWAGVVLFTAFLVLEHFLVRPGNLKNINLSFAILNGFAGIVFCIFFVLSLYFD